MKTKKSSFQIPKGFLGSRLQPLCVTTAHASRRTFPTGTRASNCLLELLLTFSQVPLAFPPRSGLRKKSLISSTNTTGLPLGSRDSAGAGGSEASQLQKVPPFTELSFQWSEGRSATGKEGNKRSNFRARVALAGNLKKQVIEC